MIRRIDLRGAQGVDYRDVVPRADFDVEAAVPAVHAICEAVRIRGLEAILEMSAQHDGVEQTDIRVPGEALHRALADLDPAIRAGLEESIRRLRLTCEAELEQDVVTDLGPGARVTHRKVPVDRVGLYVPGGLAPLVSSVLMNVVPAQVAGVGSIALSRRPRRRSTAGCRTRRSSPRARCSASTRCTPSAVRRRSRCSPTASGRAPASTWSPGRATSGSSPPSGCSRAGSASTPRPGPTEIAILADDTADAAYVAADLVSQAEHDPLAAAVLVTTSERLADDVEAELDKQVSATKHIERIRTALAGPAVGDRARRRPRPGRRRGRRLRRRAPRDPHRRRGRRRRAGAQRRRDLRRPARAGLARRLLRRLQPRAAHRRLRLPLLGAVGARVHQVGARRRLLPRRRCPRSPTTSSRWPRPRTCPATAPPSACGSAPMTWPPLREELRGLEPYGAPQLDVPVQLNVNENPYGPSPDVVADIAAAVAGVASTLNRYPDREFVELRDRAGGLPRTRRRHRPEQVWAANGSNEVMLQLLQAFGGPGRTALSFAPTYSMYPEYARDTNTDLGRGPPRRGLHARPRPRPRAGRGAAAERGAAAVAQQPDRHRAAARGGDRAVRGGRRRLLVVVDEAYGEFRRAGHAQRARAAAASTATWWSPGP